MSSTSEYPQSGIGSNVRYVKVTISSPISKRTKSGTTIPDLTLKMSLMSPLLIISWRAKAMDKFKVKCERDGTIWEAIGFPYPTKDRQTNFNNKDGDRFIECPKCARRYFLVDAAGAKFINDRERNMNAKGGDWVCDRILTILPQKNSK
jgi:hypothetical protein